MARIYYDKDADSADIINRTVAIIGYGSQGHAHSLNLHDSGVRVIVGSRDGSSSHAEATAAGLSVASIEEAAEQADVVMILAPDTCQADIYNNQIAPFMKTGDTLMFAHGFNIRYGLIDPAEGIDVSMVAPKSPGHRVRELFQEGAGTPGLVAVERDSSGRALQNALAYAAGIGCARAGVVETTFAEETETDLFGEQAVLCGGTSALVRAGFETLVEAGYQPEIAYFECLHELKLIVDLMYQGGLSYMWYSVSDTAEHGGYQGGSRLVTDETRAEMRRILADVRDGTYARGWVEENRTGLAEFKARRAREHDHPIEKVGAQLRREIPFLDAKEIAADESSDAVESTEPVAAAKE